MDALQFYILDETKKALYKNTAGNIAVAGTDNLNDQGYPAYLKYSPIGWKDTLVKWFRNTKALGMSRDCTVPLDFVKDGEAIVKDSMWNYGMDIVRYLSIKSLDKFAFPERYNHFYTGELDFSKASHKYDRMTLQVTQGGLSKDLKANENTEYEIPIYTDGLVKKLYFTGFPFTNKVEYVVYDRQEIDIDEVNLGCGIISQEGYTQGIVFQDQQFEDTPSVPNKKWFSHSETKAVTYVITGTINFDVNLNDSSVVIRFRRSRPNVGGSGSTAADFYLPITSGGLSSGAGYSFNYTINIPMQPDDRLYLEDIGTEGVGGSLLHHTIRKSNFTITYDVTFDATYVEGLSPKRYLQLLLNRISPGAQVQSNFLDSLEDSIFLTSGQALRRFGAISNLKGSFDDFIQSFKRYGIGWAVEGNDLRVELHPYFFINSVSLSLGVIKDYEVVVAEDLVCNTFKFGYPEVDTGKVNGRDEFNVTTRYTSPLKRVVQEYDIVSKYHAGMYEIEIARIDFFGQDTTDSTVDNTIYMLNTSKGVSYTYYTGDFTVISSTELDIQGRQLIPSAGDIMTITGTGTDGAYVYTNGTFQDSLSQLAFTGGGLTPGTYTGVLTLASPGTYKLNRPTFGTITGLLHPAEAFNILLRPAIAEINNARYIHSIVDTYNDSGLLTFTSGDRNSDLVTIDAGVTISEKANIPIGGTGTQYFKPYYFKCKTKIPFNYNDVMTVSPYNLVDFETDKFPGHKFSAFIWDGGAAPGDDESQQWTLLLGPDNDMTKFRKL